MTEHLFLDPRQIGSFMSTGLHLNTAEFDRMVECGAFDHLQRKIELIRGELREMNPAGPLHDGLITYLNTWSNRSAPTDSTVVTCQTGLNLSALDSRPEPDLLWLRAGRYRDHHPSAADVQLAIEVSDSSLKSDLREKAGLYAEAGIVEYWCVDAGAACIHVFRKPQNGEYADRSIAKTGESLSPLAALTVKLDIQDLFEGE